MKCDHSDKRNWIGKADGVYCQICGEKIEAKAAPAKKAPAKKAEPAEPKKAPAKKATTAKGGRKSAAK